MEIVIDFGHVNMNYEYSTERTVSGRTGNSHPLNHSRRYTSRNREADAHGRIEYSVMVIRPLPNKEEKVERFIAIGRLRNKNFPFCIANSKDYSKIDSE